MIPTPENSDLNIRSFDCLDFLSLPLPSVRQPSTIGDWRDDSESLLRLSLLRNLDNVTHPPLSEQQFSFLLDGIDSKESCPSQEMIDFFRGPIDLKSDGWKDGLAFEKSLREVIETGKKDPEKGRTALIDLSKKLSERVDHLQEGESLWFFHTVRSNTSILGHDLVKKAAVSFLPEDIAKNMSQSSSVDQLTQTMIGQFSDPLKAQLLAQIVPSFDKLKTDILESGLNSLLPSYFRGGRLEKALKIISDSFKNFVGRKLLKSFPKENRKKIQALASDIVDHGTSYAIEKQIKEMTRDLTNKISDASDSIQETICRELPQSATCFLKMLGLNGNGATWFEIKKNNHSISLRIHGMGEALQHHPIHTLSGTSKRQITLEFLIDKPESLDPHFFFHLLTQRAWPAWSPEISFTFDNLYQELSTRFGKSSKNENLCIPLEESDLIRGPGELLKQLHFRGELGRLVENNPLKWRYNLLKNELLSLWKTYNNTQEKEKWISRLHTICTHLSRLSADLYDKKIIDENELKVIYATIWEMSKKCQTMRFGRQESKDIRQQIEDTISPLVKHLLTTFGNQNHYLEAIQDVLIDVFGSDIKECIVAIIKDLPQVSQETPISENEIEQEEVQEPLLSTFWNNLIQFHAELKEDLEDASLWDILFLILKVIRKCQNLVLFSGTFSLTFRGLTLLDTALSSKWPFYKESTLLRSKVVKQILGVLTPFVVKRYLPKWVHKAYHDACKKCSIFTDRIRKYKNQIEKIILTQALKQILPRYISKEQKENINKLAKTWKSTLTREGTLSFSTDPKPSDVSQVVLDAETIEIAQPQATLDPVEIEPSPQFLSDYVPTPYRVTITPQNVISELRSWIDDISHTSAEDTTLHFYLVEQIKNLPIPTNDPSCLWQQVDHPEEVMSLLFSLIFYFKDRSDAIIISVLTIHVILTDLARRFHNYEIDEITPPSLFLFLRNPNFSVEDCVLEKRLLLIFAYFNIDTTKEYSQEDCERIDNKSLLDFHFNPTKPHRYNLDYNESMQPFLPVEKTLCAPTRNKIERLLTLFPELEKRLLSFEKDGKPLSYTERVIFLLQNPSLLNAPDKTLADSCMQETSTVDDYKGIFPTSFTWLELSYRAYRCIWHKQKFDMKKLSSFYREEEDDFDVNKIFDMTRFLPWFKRKEPQQPLMLQFVTNVIYHEFDQASTILIETDSSYRYPKLPESPDFRENDMHNKHKEIRIREDLFLHTHSSESILRTLSYYQQHFDPLCFSPVKLSSLKSYIFRFSYLENLLQQNAECVPLMAAFFHQGLARYLEHITNDFEEDSSCRSFSREPIKDYCKLLTSFISIGIDMAIKCEDTVKGSLHLFPDFEHEIRHTFLPLFSDRIDSLNPFITFVFSSLLVRLHTRKSFTHIEYSFDPKIAYDYLLFALSFKQLTHDQKKFVCEDLSPISFNAIYYDYHDHNYQIDLSLQKELVHIIHKLDDPNHVELRDFVLSKLSGIKWELNNKASWTGEFPHYICGTLELSFDTLKFSFFRNPRTRPSIQTHLITLKKEAEKLLGYPVNHIVALDQDRYLIQEIGVTLLIHNNILSFFRTEGEKIFRLLSSEKCVFTQPNKHFNGNDLIWLQTSSPCVYPLELQLGALWHNKVQRFPVLAAEETQEGKWKLSIEWNPIEEQIIEEDLKTLSHELHLLSWLTPIEKIKVWRSSKETDHFCQLSIEDLKLSFTVKKEPSGELKAYSDDGFQGFYIAKTQTHPSLKSHSKYLLLENDQHEMKVIIPYTHPAQLFASYLIASSTHPLIKHLFEKEWGLTPKNFENFYFSFSIDSQGYLSSERADALAFLVIYSLVNGHDTDLQRSLEKIQQLSRLEKFSQEVIDLLLPLSFLSLIDSRHKITHFSLQIMALLEENKLLPSMEELDDSKNTEEDIIKKAIIWGLKQTILLNYIRREKRLIDQRELLLNQDKLSEYQELLILNAISQGSVSFLKAGCAALSHEIQRMAYMIGFENTSENLMMAPLLSKRFRHLRKKYALSGEITTSKLELTFRAIGALSSSQPNAPDLPSLQFPEVSSDSSAIYELIKTIAQSILNPHWQTIETTNLIKTLNIPEWISLLSIEDDTFNQALNVPTEIENYHPGDISKYFLTYYYLATQSFSQKDLDPMQLEALHKKQRSFSSFLDQLTFVGQKREILLVKIFHVLSEKDWMLPSAQSLKNNAKTANERPQFFESDLCAILNHCKTQGLFSVFSHSPILASLSKFALSSAVSMAQKHAYSLAREAALTAFGGPIASIWQTIKWGRKGLALVQGIQSIYREETQAFAHLQSHKLPAMQTLPEDISCHLMTVDTLFDGLLKHVLDSHFTLTAAETHPPTRHIECSDNKDSLIKEHCHSFNISCCDFDERTNKILSVRCENLEQLTSALKNLEELTIPIQQRLEQEKNDILEFVNAQRKLKRKTPPTVREALLQGPKLESKETDLLAPLDFTTIAHLFLRDDSEEWKRFTFLTDEELEAVKNKLFTYFVIQSRSDQIKRIFSLAQSAHHETSENRGIILEELFREFQRIREYDISTLPAKLVRAHLVFEVINGKMLWRNQASQEDLLLLQEGEKKVVELIMGSGKTFFGIPTSDFMRTDGHSLVINIWPSAAAYVSTRQTVKQVASSFGQESYALSFDRTTKLTKNVLWGLLRRFQKCISEKSPINLSKEEAQALELKMILLTSELCDEKKQYPWEVREEKKEELFYLMRLLHIIRTKGTAVIDEVHEVFNRKKELNYPLGSYSLLDPKWTRTLYEVMHILSSTEAFFPYLHIRQDQKPIEEAIYREKILPLLCQKIVEWSFLNIPLSQREEVSAYISGHLNVIPNCVIQSSKRAHIDLIKGCVTLILPRALSLKPHEHFGPSKKNLFTEYARPYEACDKPNEQASIRSPFEAAIKTFLSFLYSGLTLHQTENLMKILKTKAQKESKKRGCPISSTGYGKLYASWFPGKSLSNVDSESIECIHTSLKHHNEAILIYAKEVCLNIRYFKKNVKNNSSNFASMFHSFLADSGSLFNHDTYPQGTQVIWDKGTQGETKHLLQIKQQISSIKILSASTAPQILSEITLSITEIDNKKCALIDRGSLLRGFSNKEVAQRILNALVQKRSPFQGVVFYNERNEQMIYEKGASSPIPLNESHLTKEQRFTYFDQAHTFASDIPQPTSGEALVTLSENTTLENFAQAVWRMRGLKNKQNITVIMTAELKEKISSQEIPTLEEVYAFIIQNEAKEIGEDNYFADRQKICDFARRTVLDKMYALCNDLDTSTCSASEAVEKYLSLFNEFQDLFVETENDDPTNLFGAIDSQENPSHLLRFILHSKWARLEKSKSFTQAEKLRMQEVLEKWEKMLCEGNHKYPTTVHTYLKDGTPSFAAQDSLFQEQVAEISIEAEQATENEVDQVKEMDQEMETNQSVNTQTKPPLSYTWGLTIPWNEDLNIFDLSWLSVEKGCHKTNIIGTTTQMGALMIQGIGSLLSSSIPRVTSKESSQSERKKNNAGVPLYSFRDFLSLTDEDSLSSASRRFDSSIFCTHNFAPAKPQRFLEKTIDPLSLQRKHSSEILVILSKDDKGHDVIQCGLIDHSDFAFWKKKLGERPYAFPNGDVHIGLYDIGLRSFVYSSDRTSLNEKNLHTNLSFLRSLSQIKFYNGDLEYTPEEMKALKKWIFEENPLQLKAVYSRIHDYKLPAFLQPLFQSLSEDIFSDESEN